MKTNWTRTLLPIVVLAAAAGVGTVACEDKPQLAPEATDLKAPEVKVPSAAMLSIDKAGSKVEFMMEAPQEKIRGRVAGAAEGELQIDPTDLSKTTGLITVNIGGIELFQTKAGDDGKFGAEEKSDLQNEHARTWLEISKDTPDDVRAKNEKAQFAIKSISDLSAKDVTKLTGAERKVTLKATGDFLLHQRKTEKTAELEALFKYEGDKPVSVSIKTVKPFGIGLDEHDVRPREAFGKLAQKTLEVLSPKVAKEAMVSLEFTANIAPMPAKGAEPAKTGEPMKEPAK